MANSLTEKLLCAGPLTDGDRAKLDGVVTRSRHVAARVDVIGEGDKPSDVHLILEGFACRYKVLPDGRRQIIAFLIPGDFCDLHVAILGEMDHGIATLTPCTVAEISREVIDDLTAHYPRITTALWWCTLVDEGILREWLVNMGQRPADRRAAHMICEVLVRLQAVGRAGEDSFELPLTQEDIGAALGLSIVHVNRTLQYLREVGLIVFKSKMLTIPDVDRLKTFAGFCPNYLHLPPKWKHAATLG